MGNHVHLLHVLKNRGDVWLLMPVAELELALMRLISAICSLRAPQCRTHVPHVEQLPALGACVVALAGVLDIAGSASDE